MSPVLIPGGGARIRTPRPAQGVCESESEPKQGLPWSKTERGLRCLPCVGSERRGREDQYVKSIGGRLDWGWGEQSSDWIESKMERCILLLHWWADS